MREQVFHEPSRAGVFHVSKDQSAPVAAIVRQAGLKVLEADVGRFSDREAMLADLGRSFHFPDWYGANFDALHDCLTDSTWQPAQGYALLISGLNELRAASPSDFQTLIDVFRSAAEIKRESGTPFWVLLDTTAPGVPPLSDA